MLYNTAIFESRKTEGRTKCWKEKAGGGIRKRTNDAKRKWHWGLGLIHMYSRLMVDFISKSHCYAMSVLLQQNEYCILSGCVSIFCWWINERIYIYCFSQTFMHFIGGKKQSLWFSLSSPLSFCSCKAFKSCILMNILIHGTLYKLTGVTVEIVRMNLVVFFMFCWRGVTFKQETSRKLSDWVCKALLLCTIGTTLILSFSYYPFLKVIQEFHFLMATVITIYILYILIYYHNIKYFKCLWL